MNITARRLTLAVAATLLLASNAACGGDDTTPRASAATSSATASLSGDTSAIGLAAEQESVSVTASTDLAR
jgi:hypothetical protein